MKTINLGRTGIETGVIGLGLEHLEKASYEEVAAIVEPALQAGMRYMELIYPGASIRSHIGRLMKGRRRLRGSLPVRGGHPGEYGGNREAVRGAVSLDESHMGKITSKNTVQLIWTARKTCCNEDGCT
jgi:aryl-alcohol dehydrogenase-like predicted oxidoreductase